MASISQAERAKIPAEDFAGPGRTFYIRNQQDVADAARLIGKAKNPAAVKAKILAICRRKKLDPPEAWEGPDKGQEPPGDTDKMSITFSGGRRLIDGEWAVYPDALLFKAGEYPDKDLTVSPEDLWLAVDQFQPVGGNIEHTEYLKGKACELRSVRLSEDGGSLHGEVAVPLWLDEHLGPHERRLSTEWHRADKRLDGLALVVNPRVADAALMSAEATFAKANTPHGKSRLQALHDLAAAGGARCQTGAATMTAAHEATALQAIHDVATKHGASCSPDGGPAVASFGEPQKGRRMSALDKLKAFFSANPDALAELTETPPAPEPAAPPAPPPVPAPPDPQIAVLSAQLAEMTARQRQTEAAAFADGQIAAGRAQPAERPAIIAAFTRAAEDDAANPAVVTFAEGQTGGRLDMLKALFAARPAGVLTREMLPDGLDAEQIKANFTTTPQPGEGPISEERLAKLLGATPLGEAVLAHQRQNGKGV